MTSHESKSGPLNVRHDVVQMFHDRPFATFEEIYDQLKDLGIEDTIQLLGEGVHYSDDKNEQQAFAAGVLHVLRIQLASREFDSLEASLRLNAFPSDGDDDEGSPHLDGPGDGQPAA